MSWMITAVGTPDQLRESIRRHHHQYWRIHPAASPENAREAVVRNFVLGHALKRADPQMTYILEAHGSCRFSYSVQVDLRPVLMPPLPVPDGTATPFDAPP